MWVTLNKKSRLMAYMSAVVEKTDEEVAEVVDQFLSGVELPHGSEKPKLSVRFTPTDLFVRGTIDWNMIKEYSEMALLLQDLGLRPGMNLKRRIDEAYPCIPWVGLRKLREVNNLKRNARTSGSFGGSKKLVL